MSTVWKRTNCFLWGTFAAILVSGCAETQSWLHNGYKVGPEYCKPAAAVAEHWIDFNNPEVINQQQGVDHGAWWLALNDPMLNQLVFQSYQENLNLRAAGMRVLEARARRDVAAGSLFPQSQQIVGGYDHTQNSLAFNPNGFRASRVRTFDRWSTGLDVGWELDLWGRFRRNIESAEANVDASIEDYDDVLVVLIAETAAAYVEIRRAEERLQFARENVVSQRKSLELADAQFQNEVVGELDVTQARSNVASTEALIPELQESLRNANNRLCVLMGTPPRDLQPELGAAPIPTVPSDLVVGIPAELLRRRPDIRRAERQVASQSARIGVATADLFPSFSIIGSINWQANDFSDLFSSTANGGNIGPGFNWNILNYGRIKNNILVQDARFQELAIVYQQAVLEANAEVEDAIIGYLTAQQRIRVLTEGVEASGKSVGFALEQYGEIEISFNRVANLQSTLTQQQDQLAVARADAALSLIRLYKALGGGWQIRQAQPASFAMVEADSNGADPAANVAGVTAATGTVAPPVKVANTPAGVTTTPDAGDKVAVNVAQTFTMLTEPDPKPATIAPKSASPKPGHVPAKTEPVRQASQPTATSDTAVSSATSSSIVVTEWKTGDGPVLEKAGVVREAVGLQNANYPIQLYKADARQSKIIVQDVTPIEFSKGEGAE